MGGIVDHIIIDECYLGTSSIPGQVVSILFTSLMRRSVDRIGTKRLIQPFIKVLNCIFAKDC